MQLTRLHQVGARANDLDEAEAWYGDILGAELIARYDPPGLLFFKFGATRLLLEKETSPATLYFEVTDIGQAHEELKAKGVSFLSDPHLVYKDENGTFGDKGVEEWMSFFMDPSGNTLAIVSRKQAG